MATIGVYGFDRDSFLAALAATRIDLLLDVRQRRGVRGSEYVRRCTEEILDPVDLGPIVNWIGAGSAALLCVERDPEACHRSPDRGAAGERLGLRRRASAPGCGTWLILKL